MSATDDPDVLRLREQLTAVDERIVEAVNARIELVAELKRVKELRGLSFHDPDREAWLVRHLEETSSGRLSPEGLRALYAEVLALTKRELEG